MLTENKVKTILEDSFPGLKIHHLKEIQEMRRLEPAGQQGFPRPSGSKREYDAVYLINHQYYFKFAANWLHATDMRKTKTLLGKIQSYFDIAVPRYDYYSEGHELYPFCYAGYKAIKGISLHQAMPDAQFWSEKHWQEILAQIGQFLTSLHKIPTQLLSPPKTSFDRPLLITDDAFREQFVALIDIAKNQPAVNSRLVEALQRLLSKADNWEKSAQSAADRDCFICHGFADYLLKLQIQHDKSVFPEVRPSAIRHYRKLSHIDQFEYVTAITHRDFNWGHILVDPDKKKLTGIIDFERVTVSAPIYDMSGLFDLSVPRVDQILKHYTHPLKDKLLKQLHLLRSVKFDCEKKTKWAINNA